VLVGAAPGVLLGFADLWFYTGTYVADLSMQLLLLLAGFLVAACIAVGGALVRLRGEQLVTGRRWVSRVAVAGAAVAAVALATMATRPWWSVSHGPADNGLVRGIQEREGSPIDGTRLYAEDTFQWLSWYYGWPLLLVGLGGLLAWLVVGARRDTANLLWVAALFLPSAILYLFRPDITPDQIWAMRRFLPVVIPGLLLAATWVARRLAARGRVGVVVAAGLVAATVVWPLTATEDVWTAKSKGGALLGNRQVCDQIDDRPTVVTGVDTYLPTVLVLCDVPAISVPHPTPELLTEARETLGGGSVVLVTRAPGAVPWVDEPPAQHTFPQTVLEQSLVGPPDQIFTQLMGVTLGRVQPDGTVVPLARPR
jgi:hypothetical protein